MDVAAVLGEAVLVTACGLGGLTVLRARPGAAWPWAAAGLGLIGLAGALGAMRFAGVEAVAPVHDVFSKVATAGVTLLGIGWLGWAWPRRAWHAVGAALLGITVVLVAVWPDGPWRLPVSLLGVVGVLTAAAVGLRASTGAAVAGLAGIAAVVLAGLVVGGDGVWLGLERREWFHLVLAAGLLGVSLGLVWTAPRRVAED